MGRDGAARSSWPAATATSCGSCGALCQGLPFTVVSALDYPGLPEVIEDGTTTLGNASRKAIVTAAFTGEIAVADDTALQVRD